MKKFLCILAIVAVSCASANAAIATYSWSQASTSTNWTQTFALPQFDPSLGALNSVTLAVNGNVLQTLMYENLDGEGSITFAIAGDGKTGCDFLVKFSGGATLLSKAVDNTPTYVFGVYDGALDFGGTSGATIATSCDGSANNVYTGVDMSQFIGTGNVSFDATATGRSAYTFSSGAGAAGVTTKAGADVTITYDYVPEPATLAILGLGGLLLRRRIA